MLSLLSGVLGGNALPHFMRGITRQRYPSAVGNGPIPNFIAGWVGLVLTAIPLHWAHIDRHPGPRAPPRRPECSSSACSTPDPAPSAGERKPNPRPASRMRSITGSVAAPGHL